MAGFGKNLANVNPLGLLKYVIYRLNTLLWHSKWEQQNINCS